MIVRSSTILQRVVHDQNTINRYPSVNYYNKSVRTDGCDFIAVDGVI